MFPHRTQSNCSSFTPAASAECGSKLSQPSTSAHASASLVLPAKAETSRVARPEQGGPQISVSAPRGNPPVSESTSETPNGAVSTRIRRGANGAATRPASAVSTWERKAAMLTAIGQPAANRDVEQKRSGSTLLKFAFYSPTANSGRHPCPCQLSAKLQRRALQRNDELNAFDLFFVQASIVGDKNVDARSRGTR